MENSSIITTIIVLTLLAVPFMIMARKKSKKAKLLLKKFQSVGESQNLHLSEHDIWHNRGLGIDRKSKCIIYAKGDEFSDIIEKVDLQKVRRSEINKIMKISGTVSAVDRIDLRIVFKESSTPHLLLEFYNVQGGTMINDEYHLAEKWERIINNHSETTC
jgi:hypothetical protein